MTPRLSCFTNAYGASGVRAAVERVGEAGIHLVELPLRGHNFGGLVIPEEAVITEKADTDTVSEFLDLMASHGVGVSACNVGGADIRTAEGVELTERRLFFAARHFAPPIAVSGAGQPADADERRLVIANLRRLGDVAGELGLTLALETHKGPTQNADAMLALMGELNHPSIRLNFDTGNIAYYNEGADPVAELEKVAPLVANVHLKDNRGRSEDWFFPAFGDGGAVDCLAIRGVLDRAGYKGVYTIEIEGIGGEPDPGLEGRHDRVRRSVQYLRARGFLEEGEVKDSLPPSERPK
ncbi:MAG: sugar phosphate isomerase/epimerase [Isosphaeraceae bacterium]